MKTAAEPAGAAAHWVRVLGLVRCGDAELAAPSIGLGTNHELVPEPIRVDPDLA
jgi:hypothetical protein